MILLLTSILIAIPVVLAAAQVLGRLRFLSSSPDSQVSLVSADRYRPMLRLLSDDDTSFVGANTPLSRKLRASRVRIFRDYLRCLTKDYGKVLASLRLAMVQSGVDRPDLARLVTKNEFAFAMATCRIEFRVMMYSLGIGKVDVSGLERVIEALRLQTQIQMALPVAVGAN